MALLSLPSISISSFTKFQPPMFSIPKLSTNTIATANMSDQPKVRRSANYPPTIWNNDYIQSLNTPFSGGDSIDPRIKKLKTEVRKLLHQVENSRERIELIAMLQRLGLSYQFEDEIRKGLETIYNDSYVDHMKEMKEDLHTTALEFRLLREYGYQVSQDIFNTFKDKSGEFKSCLGEDIEGLISLYEASFLLEEGERILEDARVFTTKCLKKFIKEHESHEYHSILATHALELPQHWRMLRFEARWFIDAYTKYEHMNPLLLELAKLDFNHGQTIHQEDLKYVSKWWSNTGLGQELTFARDRLMENFFWTVGVTFQPDFSYCRRMSTKVYALITTIDDIYDVYGTLDELEQFTTTVERWNIDAIEQLPNYMKLCFLTLYNSLNEMGFDIFKEQGFYIIPHLKKVWVDLCKSYLLEAKWYYNGYTPTLQEYLDNAWISISAPVILVHAYSYVAAPMTKDTIDILMDYPPIVKWPAMILRLENDLKTSSHELKRGDVPKSIQCYMAEVGASESEAREYIHYLIDETWKKMNKDRRIAKSMFPMNFIDTSVNLARMAQCMYQNGDGHGVQQSNIRHLIISVLTKAIAIN